MFCIYCYKCAYDKLLGISISGTNLPLWSCIPGIITDYNLDLTFEGVNPDKISLADYESVVRAIAVEQRATLDYIEQKLADSNSIDNTLTFRSNRSSVFRDVTKSTNTQYCNIRAQYYANLDQHRVGSFQGAQLLIVNTGCLGTFVANQSGPSSSIIDGGRTLMVSFTGDIHPCGNSYGIGNMTIKSEYTYTD